MANTYSATALQDARLMISDPNNKKFELRPTISNITEGFIKYADMAFVDLARIKNAETQTTTAQYFQNTTTTIGTAKSCSPTGEEGATASVNLTWATKTFTARLENKKFAGNEVSMQRAFAEQLYNREKDFWFGASGIDAALLTYLNANRTQVNAISASGVGQSTWDAVNYIAKVANADISRFYDYLLPEMALNNYEPTLQEFCNTMWLADWKHYYNQGAGNSTNLNYQFEGVETMKSNLIVPATYYRSTNYIVPAGGVAMVTWNDPLNRAGKVSGEKTWGTYQSMFFPELTFDVFAIESCEDTSTSGGAKQDNVINYEFALNYSINKQPLSTANETPIFKYGILSS